MGIKKFLVLVVLIVSSTVLAQESLNSYKYVIVPQKYDFLKSDNQYQLNSLTKFLFKKEGFTVLSDTDSTPQDLARNSCLGLVAKVNSDSGLFTTKLKLTLVNCRNKVVFSEEGKSKQKDYKKAFHEALRNAFESVTALDYKYEAGNSLIDTTEETEEQEPVEVKPPKAVEVAIEEPVEEVVEVSKQDKPVITTSAKEETNVEEITEEVIEEVVPVAEEVKLGTPPNTPNAPEISIKEEKVTVRKVEFESDVNMLYAQENTLGYQLVDSAPKVIYVLLKSGREDIYFLRNKKGIVYKENGRWIAEYYDLDTLVRKSLNIKF